MAKIQILGGGIAGLALAISLAERKIKAQIFERASHYGDVGLGFILLENGVRALDRLNIGAKARELGQRLDTAVLADSSGSILHQLQLDTAYGVKRTDFIRMLREAVVPDWIRTDFEFTHFENDTAVFSNGERVSGDLFIGADGVRSRVRSELFPTHSLTPVVVKELVSRVYAPKIASQLGTRFLKLQVRDGGLAVGMVPTGADELVWYIQYDSRKIDIQDATPAGKKDFVEKYVGRFAQPVPELIQKTDFALSHIWFTSDMELLPRLYQQRTVLIGDAAHPLLTFTSQGVSSALEDGTLLGEELSAGSFDEVSLRRKLESFSNQRREALRNFVEAGRQLRERFLHPDRFAGEIQVPLAK